MGRKKKVAKHLGKYITGFIFEPIMGIEAIPEARFSIYYTNVPEDAAEIPEEQLKFLKKALNIEILEI